jgi:hypothetical protein
MKFGTHSDLQFETSNVAHGLEFVSVVHVTVDRCPSQYSGTDTEQQYTKTKNLSLILIFQYGCKQLLLREKSGLQA